MHPAECGCVDILRAIIEQLSVLHQRFYSNLLQNLMDSSIFLHIYYFILSGALTKPLS